MLRRMNIIIHRGIFSQIYHGGNIYNFPLFQLGKFSFCKMNRDPQVTDFMTVNFLSPHSQRYLNHFDWIRVTLLFLSIRILFLRPRQNISIFLLFLGWKCSCEGIFRLWHWINFGATHKWSNEHMTSWCFYCFLASFVVKRFFQFVPGFVKTI